MKKIIFHVLVITFFLVSCKKDDDKKNPNNAFPLSSIPCPGSPTVSDADGNVYPTVLIGSQCWMKKNLNVRNITSSCYDKVDSNCNIYGRLYLWHDMMNGSSSSNSVPSGVQGICPDGWHIPSAAEWDILINYLGGDTIAGGKLKETGTTHWDQPNAGASNSSGFSALPGGYIAYAATFTYHDLGRNAYFWSTTNPNGFMPRCYLLTYKDDYIQYWTTDMYTWVSLRCLRN